MLHDFAFLIVLAVVVAAALQHAKAVRAAGRLPRNVRSQLHATLNIAVLIGSFGLLPATVVWHTWLFLLLAPMGFAIGLRNMSYASRISVTEVESRREIASSQIGASLAVAVGVAALYF